MEDFHKFVDFFQNNDQEFLVSVKKNNIKHSIPSFIVFHSLLWTVFGRLLKEDIVIPTYICTDCSWTELKLEHLWPSSRGITYRYCWVSLSRSWYQCHQSQPKLYSAINLYHWPSHQPIAESIKRPTGKPPLKHKYNVLQIFIS